MDAISYEANQRVTKVCRNGHVFSGHADGDTSHCERCGAEAVGRCATCGHPLRVGRGDSVPGLVTIGPPRPPAHCSACGASFPWAARPSASRAGAPLADLEKLLRRLPRVARQLRARHGDRPAFRVADDYDLEDLLRALLALHFDEVWPEGRTPSYAPGVRTDLRVDRGEGEPPVVVACRRVATPVDEGRLAAQLREDVAHYQPRRAGGVLIALLYDPEGLLPNPESLETRWSGQEGEWQFRCVIAR